MLEEVIKEINKNFKSSVCNLGIEFEEIPRIPFSSPNLNYMLYGGLPVGRIVEFFGEEQSGKTTTTLDVVKQAQKLFPDKTVLFMDIERTLDEAWSRKLGVDTSKLLVYSPPEGTSAETIFEDCKKLVSTGNISLAVIDSLGALVSAQAYSKSIEERTYGGVSMPLTIFSKEMIPICARTRCTLIGINQVREDMNSTYGGVTTTGGKAWKHSCSVRIEFRKGNYIDTKGNVLPRSCENPAGNIVNAALIKSKVCNLDRKIAHYTINYLEGIDYIADIIDLAIKNQKILASGAWFSIIDPETGEILKEGDKLLKFQGRTKLSEYIKENPDLQEKLI